MYSDLFFNVDGGYLEGLVRGFRSGILKRTDYHNLEQCETLEGWYLYLTFVFFLGGHVIHLMMACSYLFYIFQSYILIMLYQDF